MDFGRAPNLVSRSTNPSIGVTMAPKERPSDPRVVFIAGLGHSGSTLLEQLLATHPEVMGVGTVGTLVHRDTADVRRIHQTKGCSCGELLVDCEVWGSLLADFIDVRDGMSKPEQYGWLLRGLDAKVGASTPVLVDSSKNARDLRLLDDLDLDLQVVRLTRDVRSWSVSSRDRHRRQGDIRLRALVRSSGTRGFRRWLSLTSFYRFRVWFQVNRRIDLAAREATVPCVWLGYESYATSPSSVLTALFRDLGLDQTVPDLRPSAGTTHTLGGNDLKTNAAKLEAVTYSTRWMARRSWLLPSLLSPRTMAYNDRVVHGDVDQAAVNTYR